MSSLAKPLEIDAREFFARLDLADKTVREAARKAMKENALDLERKSGELAPVDEGILLGSSSTQVNTSRNAAFEIESTVSYNTPYAASVHERMFPAPAPSSGSAMQPGPITRAKPGNEMGSAGGWYLRRPLFTKANDYWEHTAKTIKKALDHRTMLRIAGSFGLGE